MKKLSVVFVAVCLILSGTAAVARGGHGGSAHSGGAAGTSVSAPGTNSAGTALSSGGNAAAQKGPLLGTNSAVDKEDAKVDKLIRSICRGC
jgi:hypothetical protein